MEIMVSMRAKPQKTKFQEVIYYASIKLFRYDLCLQPERALFKGDIRVGGSGAKSSMETCCESFKEARCPTPPAVAVRKWCRLQGAELYL